MNHLVQGVVLIRANQGHSISTVEVKFMQLELFFVFWRKTIFFWNFDAKLKCD